MYIKRTCDKFVFENDRNGELAIGACTAMCTLGQDHEGNYGVYPCPLGKFPKACYHIESMGSSKSELFSRTKKYEVK